MSTLTIIEHRGLNKNESRLGDLPNEWKIARELFKEWLVRTQQIVTCTVANI